MNCNVIINIDGKDETINGLDFWENINIKTINGSANLKYSLNPTDCFSKNFIKEGKSIRESVELEIYVRIENSNNEFIFS